MLSGTVAKEYISDLNSTLSYSDLYKWFVFATDGSSDENDKFLHILIRNFATNGLVTTSLIDIYDIDKGSDSNRMFETLTSLLRKASLSWETCCTYSSGNTSTVVGKNKNLLKQIKDIQVESSQKIFDIGCSCYLAHLCAQKDTKVFTIRVDEYVIDLFYHFKRSVKRKVTLRDYMTFTNTKVKKITVSNM